MSRKPHSPTDETRAMVRLHATAGTTHEMVSKLLGIDGKTMRKYYRAELDFSSAEANAIIGGALFEKAKGGDTAAAIFWMKTRAGWREKDHGDNQMVIINNNTQKPSREELIAELERRGLPTQIFGDTDD